MDACAALMATRYATFSHAATYRSNGSNLAAIKMLRNSLHVQRLSGSVADVDDTRVTHSFDKTSFREPGYADVPT